MACLTPTPPASSNVVSTAYGAPRGAAGRRGYPIAGIVIHCLGRSIEQYNTEICAPSVARRTDKHTSLHYAFGTDGSAYQYVAEADMAWGMQAYPSSFPDFTPLQPIVGWTSLPANYPGVSIDHYTIQIGIAVPKTSNNQTGCQGCSDCGCDDCDCKTFGLNSLAYANLVRMVAYLAAKYSIPIDNQHIWMHDRIVDTPDGAEECQCVPACFNCDVSAYCEACAYPGDASYRAAPGVVFFYGEDANGCKVKSSVAITVSETPNTIVNTDTVVGTVSGANNRNLSFSIRVAGTQGNVANQVQTIPNQGLYVPLGAGISTAVTPTVSTSFNPLTGVVSAQARISGNAGNRLMANADGLFVSSSTIVTSTDICAAVVAMVDGGFAIAGATKLVGNDCKVYTLPSSFTNTPLSVIDSTTINFATSGTDSHTLTGAVLLSSSSGNAISIQGGGLYVPPPPTADVCAIIGAFATNGQALTGVTRLVGADCKTYTIPASPGQTPVSVNSTSSILLTANGTDNHNLTASTKLSATAGNILIVNTDGLYVPAAGAFNLCNAVLGLIDNGTATPGATRFVGADCNIYTLPTLGGGVGGAETPIVPSNTATVNMTAGATGSGHTGLSADVRVSSTAGNILTSDASGLFVPTPGAATETVLTVTDTSAINLTAGATGNGHTGLTASLIISPDAGNVAVVRTNGVFVPSPSASETALTVVDSISIDLVAGATGNGHTGLSANIIESPDANNAFSVRLNGVYVPTTCSVLGAAANALANAVPGTTRLIGKDCNAYLLPGANSGIKFDAVSGNYQLDGTLLSPSLINVTNANYLRIASVSGQSHADFKETEIDLSVFNPAFSQQNQIDVSPTRVIATAICTSGNLSDMYVDCGSAQLKTVDAGLGVGVNTAFVRSQLGFIVQIQGNAELLTYPNTRDDWAITNPANFLYTAAAGQVRSTKSVYLQNRRKITITAAAAFTLTYDHDVIRHSGPAATWTLPAVVTAAYFRIANAGTGAITLSSTFTNLSGVVVSTIAAGTVVEIAHDGATGWYQV